jgi:hypothetical protein
VLVLRQIVPRNQPAAGRQVLLGDQLHSGLREGFHGLLESLGRGYGEPCRQRSLLAWSKPIEDSQAIELSYPIGQGGIWGGPKRAYSPECVESRILDPLYSGYCI